MLKKVKKVTVHYPTDENKKDFQKRAARSLAEVLCKKYPLEVIDKIIERLKREEQLD